MIRALVLASAPHTLRRHRGQIHGMSPARLARRFGDRAQRWKHPRSRLLDSAVACAVFASPLRDEVGLGG
jgi:hypothetical protein